MRELFISVLVLSLVSVLSATPVVSLTSNDSNSVTVTPGTTVQVDLSLGFDCSGIYQIDFIASGDTSINSIGSWIPAMQEQAGWSNGSYNPDGSSIDNASGFSDSDISAGADLYSFMITVDGSGSISPFMDSSDQTYSYDSNTYTGDELTMSELTVSTPEPASIILLGAAGLFLRKRKN